MFTKPEFSWKMRKKLSDCIFKRRNSEHSCFDESEEDDCLLHASSSSRSSVSPMSIPENLVSEMVEGGAQGELFATNDDNPEAMFDMLTLQSLRERYSDTDKASSTEDISAVISDQEFDDFVRDFPIDDSISECFAAAPDQIVPSVNVVSKISSSPTKQNKLKKKLVQRNGNEETILSDEDSRSSDSKRSKLIGNLFGRRNKGKEGYKPLKQTDTTNGSDITDAIIDACEHITKSYKKAKQNSAANSVTSDKSSRREKISRSTGSVDNYSDKSQKVASVVGSPTVVGSPNKVLPNSDKMLLRKLPPVPGPDEVADKGYPISPRPVVQNVINTGIIKRIANTGSGLFESIENLTDEQLVQNISALSENTIRETRDKHGNTILHRCILADKEETVLMLLSHFPDLSDVTNDDGDTAIELAVKLGRTKCLVLLMETTSKYKSEEMTVLAPVMSIAAENGQSECLRIIISYLSPDHSSIRELPADTSGNTAAHIASIFGHLGCLQVLVESGYNIWNVNKEGHRPMQLAIQNNHIECFQYLLMLECSQCLVREAVSNAVTADRIKSQRMNMQASMQQLEQHLNKHYTQFNDALRNMLESRKNILQSVEAVYSGTTDILQNAGIENNDAVISDMENMKAEMERLQDLLEFSPLANSSDILSRMVSAFQDLVVSDKDNKHLDSNLEIKKSELGVKWSSMIKRFQSTPNSCSESNIQQHIDELVTSLKETILAESVDNNEQRSSNIVTAKHNVKCISGNEVQFPSFPTSSSNRPAKTRHRKEETRHRNRHMGHSRHKDSLREHNGDFPLRGHFANVSDADSESTVSELPFLESPSGTESLYTSTLTSGVTCTDITSEKTSRIGTMSGDTSDSESDWWDDPRHKRRHKSKLNRQNNVFDDSESSNTVRLNLEHEDLPDDVLRQHRLNQHLQSMHKVNNHRNDFVETVITATGKRMGGREQPSKTNSGSNRNLINSLSNGANSNLKGKSTKPTYKEKNRPKSTKLFSLQDMVSSREMSPSEFLESYDRSRGTSSDLRWDEMSLTDAEEAKQNEKPWYEMSDDEESMIHTWKSDDEEEQSRDYREV